VAVRKLAEVPAGAGWGLAGWGVIAGHVVRETVGGVGRGGEVGTVGAVRHWNLGLRSHCSANQQGLNLVLPGFDSHPAHRKYERRRGAPIL
jgi:hypothetical protein